MRRTPGRTFIPPEVKEKLGVYRYDREIPYASATYGLDCLSESESKDPIVSQSALKLGQQLIVEFRYRRKVEHGRRCSDFIHWEYQTRNRLGVFFSLMNVEVESALRERLHDLYLEIPPQWA